MTSTEATVATILLLGALAVLLTLDYLLTPDDDFDDDDLMLDDHCPH